MDANLNTAKFTVELRKVYELAFEAAKKYKTNYVGSEHVILAMLSLKDCNVYEILQAAGVTAQAYFLEARKYFQERHDPVQSLHLTAKTYHAFVFAEGLAAAENEGNWYTGTEHVLYAFINELGCVGRRVLNMLVNPDVLKRSLEILVRPLTPEEKKNLIIQTGGVDDWTDYPDREIPETLRPYGTDMTRLARARKLDPVIGRRKEIDRVVQILSRRSKNNPVLIGEPGVGKSAVIEGLACEIVDGKVPDILRYKTLFSLNVASLLAGTRYRGDFEERLEKIVNEIKNDSDIILFIDEIHMIVGAGSSTDSSMDAANMLKPMLARGELQTIGATTIEEYHKYIEKDAALERRFTPVLVEEPTTEDAIRILTGLREKYEMFHNIIITDEAIEAAVNLSDRYITDRFLPDKAIDLMDEAASRARVASSKSDPEICEMEDRIWRLKSEHAKAYKRGDEAQVKAITDEMKSLSTRLSKARSEWEIKSDEEHISITADDIAAIVSDQTGVPVSRINERESERLLRLEEEIHGRIIGQDEAVTAVCKAIRRARAGLKEPNRPIGSFIFVGPTGVGKTDLAKALAEAMFGDERLMIRLDMSEYMEKSSVSKIIGAPPGYVGYEDAESTLTERVRRKPYSVVLFDEIEKAHPDVFNVLLQLLDDGRLTDSKGRVVSFKNTVIILTSNIGAHMAADAPRLGFGAEDEENKYIDMKERINESLKKHFRPEFLNRLDDIIIFRRLSREEAAHICDKLIAGLAKRLQERDIKIKITDRAREKLVEEGYSEENGARPLKRTIQRRIEDRLSDEILRGNVLPGETVEIDASDGVLKFRSYQA